MSEIPADLRYTKTHEWVRIEDDGLLTIGITYHAQDLLGDLVFVETPELGAGLDAEVACGVVESVKAASDIYAPLTGEVVAVNEALADAPDLVNGDPYGNGWLYQLRPADAAALEALMEAADYQAFIEA